MDSIQLQSYKSLTALSPSIIHVGTFVENSEETSSIELSILPSLDLILEYELVLDCTCSSRGSVKVFARNPSLIPKRLISNSNEIKIDWLENSKYPLAVWFYSIRNTFKRENESPWTTPIHKRASFSTNGNENDDMITLIAGAGRNRGRRPYMEDVDFAYDSIKITDRSFISLYGVLDGHGGQECARFAADEIPMKVIAELRQKKSFAEALFNAFVETDHDFLKGQSSSAGSTANILLWDAATSTMVVANSGDTRAVMSRNHIAIDISDDKKASHPEEIARVAQEGGFVVNGRVMGSLAVARALGDSHLKELDGELENGKEKRKRFIIPDPEVVTFVPTAQDEFIIIASDGLWDVMSSQDAVDMVQENLTNLQIGTEFVDVAPAREELKKLLSQIGDYMSTYASKTLKSMDNVTVMIILLARTLGVRKPLPIRSTSSTNDIDYKQPPPTTTSGAINRMTIEDTSTSSSSSNYLYPSSDINDDSSSFTSPLSPTKLTHEIEALLASQSPVRSSAKSLSSIPTRSQSKSNIAKPSTTFPVMVVHSSPSSNDDKSTAVDSHERKLKDDDKKKHTDEEDDDLMGYLLDDTNF